MNCNANANFSVPNKPSYYGNGFQIHVSEYLEAGEYKCKKGMRCDCDYKSGGCHISKVRPTDIIVRLKRYT